MDSMIEFIQTHRPYVDVAQALSAVVNLIGWSLGAILLVRAWHNKAIHSVSVGPINIKMQQAAIEATAAATRDWQAKSGQPEVDVTRIRSTVGRAFSPEVADRLIGKAILWVDDNPANNELGVRALRKLQLDVEQATSTEQGLAAMDRRHFDLVVSDMGRGDNMRAGYELLSAIRARGMTVPFLIFAGSDGPEFRREAAERGAQLSTNSIIELIDTIISHLG